VHVGLVAAKTFARLYHRGRVESFFRRHVCDAERRRLRAAKEPRDDSGHGVFVPAIAKILKLFEAPQFQRQCIGVNAGALPPLRTSGDPSGP